MIDWNRNGRIDPEDAVLTEIIRSAEDDPEEPEQGESGRIPPHTGCLLTLLLLPFSLLWGGRKQ